MLTDQVKFLLPLPQYDTSDHQWIDLQDKYILAEPSYFLRFKFNDYFLSTESTLDQAGSLTLRPCTAMTPHQPILLINAGENFYYIAFPQLGSLLGGKGNPAEYVAIARNWSVLTVQNASLENGAAVLLEPLVRGNHQKFQLIHASQDCYYFQAKHSGKVLEYASDGLVKYHVIQQGEFTRNDCQKIGLHKA